MDKFCEDCIHNEVCQYGAHCPSSHCNDKDTLDDLRPQGEWIDYSEDGYLECPFCNHLTNCEGNIDELHYCWNCGAKMESGAE